MNDEINELLETIKNLMSIVDTPIGRRKNKGEFADEIRQQARKIIEKYE